MFFVNFSCQNHKYFLFLSVEMTKTLQSIKNSLYNKGFDIQVLFSSNVYNDHLKRENISDYELPEANISLLIGNSKVLWSNFIKDLKDFKSLRDPLDSWTKSEILDISRRHSSNFSIYLVFDDFISVNQNKRVDGKKRIAFQKLGNSIGYAINVPDTGLSITPEFGPWFAYRAVLQFHDLNSKDLICKTPIQNLKDSQDLENLEKWMNDSIPITKRIEFAQKIQQAFTKSDKDSFSDFIKLRQEISSLLKRDEFEYNYNQMMYHYTKDYKYLKD